MLISTRGRYALRVMLDLAEKKDKNLVPLKEIVLKEDVSQKYLEGIMTELSKAGLVIGVHGKNGGYKLAVPAEECTVKAVLEVTECSLSPVSCIQNKNNVCPRKKQCKTLPMWEKLDFLISDFFQNITLKSLL